MWSSYMKIHRKELVPQRIYITANIRTVYIYTWHKNCITFHKNMWYIQKNGYHCVYYN